jgi:DUF4097 and DUF4098 domain-containing protein YvlB
MKNLFLLFISVFLFAGCATNRATAQQNAPQISRSFPASSIQSVEANTSGGSITVVGDTRSQATVEVFASNNNLSESRIKQLLEENYDIDIRVQNGKLIATAKPKRQITNWNQNGLSISFKISVPSGASSDLKTSGGSIHLSNLNGGSQNFQTSGGSLSIDNVRGNISGRTSGGSINVTNSHNNIDLRTSGGSITAQNSSGTLNLRTSGGSLNLTNLNGNIEATTSGGSINANDIQGTLKTRTSGGSINLNRLSGNVEASTSGGSMNVEMRSVNEFVRLTNSSGNLSVTLPANQGYRLDISARNRIDTSGLQNFNGNMNERSINGNVGAGGAEINARGQRVNLNFR